MERPIILALKSSEAIQVVSALIFASRNMCDECANKMLHIVERLIDKIYMEVFEDED